ncbi:MAG: polyprenyl synthetase family protein [Pyrinomonadaceae bacterium]|nr:polyprenyl synthetase family protein [Pyrinomonadaceae bacterium]
MSKFADLWRYVETNKPFIENALRENLPFAPDFIKTNFNEALNYSMFPGGKRLRPVLTLLGAEIVGGKRESALLAAVAVEFVHTSSLIFDDLPCMDDSDERRGKTSLHQQFDEGTAVLIGLALLNISYSLVLKTPNENAFYAHAELVRCIGASGMVGGQAIDLEIAKNGETIDAQQFETVRNLKTSALIRMAICVGAILGGANEKQLTALTKFSELLGDAYQTSDDLLDLAEDLHISNTTHRRENLALEQGVDVAKKRVENFISEAKNVLNQTFSDDDAKKMLFQLADYIAERKV